MNETAAHLVERVFPVQPFQKWVLSAPKRLRYFLQRDRFVSKAALQLFLCDIKAELIREFQRNNSAYTSQGKLSRSNRL
jgi:hypothetical protein